MCHSSCVTNSFFVFTAPQKLIKETVEPVILGTDQMFLDTSCLYICLDYLYLLFAQSPHGLFFYQRVAECTNITTCYNELVSMERGELRAYQQLQACSVMHQAVQNITESVEIVDSNFRTEVGIRLRGSSDCTRRDWRAGFAYIKLK